MLSSIGVKHLIGTDRSSSWTITPVLSASGELVASQVILHGASVDSSVVRRFGENGISFHLTQSGFQDKRTFDEFTSVWTRKTKATISNPGMVVMDGHSSHMSRNFLKTCMEKFILPVVKPSQLSILVQAGDNGVNAVIDSTYKEEYSTIFTTNRGHLTIEDRLMCVLRALTKCHTRI